MISEAELNIAYKKCSDFAKTHYENFPVASLLFPKNKRKFVHSVYCFARIADDIADSVKLKPGEKLALLDEYEKELLDSVKGNFENIKRENKSVFIALSNTIKILNIPLNEFLNLLKAFKQDSVKNRYVEFNELLEYSTFSANPIGHLVLIISGFHNSDYIKLSEYSDKICTALQLTNFWQDVNNDLKMDRIYIPQEIMKQHSYDENVLFSGTENQNFRELISDLVERTKNLFSEGKPLINELSGKFKLELKAIINGGTNILDKIEKINFNVLSKRVELNFTDKFKIFVKSLI